MENQVRFVRIKGRVIPIRLKKKENRKMFGAGVKSAAGVSTVLLTKKLAEKDLSKSFKFFRKGSDFAAMRKLVSRKSPNRTKFIKESAKFKIKGKKFSKRGNFKLNLGIGIGSLLLGSATSDVFESTVKNKLAKDFSDEVGGAVSAGLTFAVTSIIAKRFKVKARSVEGLTGALRSRGSALASKKLIRVRKSGVFPKGPKK
jgi:hypothetical protein